MERLMKKFFKSSIVMSLLLITLGILLVFYSEVTIISISYVIGGILIAIGVLAILKFIKNANSKNPDSLDIVYGMVSIILGILVITHPSAIASFIPLVIGIMIMINSGTKLQYALELKANKNKIWKSTMVIAIISAVCGVLLLFNPFKGAVVITQIIGIFILIYAVLDLISTISIRKNVLKIHTAIEESILDAVVIEETEDKKVKKKKKDE